MSIGKLRKNFRSGIIEIPDFPARRWTGVHMPSRGTNNIFNWVDEIQVYFYNSEMAVDFAFYEPFQVRYRNSL
jgi:hypothetical protein